MGIFDFFRRAKTDSPPNKQEEELGTDPEEEDVVASITYLMTVDGEPYVNIELKNYEENTIERFSELLMGLGSDSFYFDTVSMAREGFIVDGKDDVFVEIATKIADATLENLKEEPCFKPSDLL
jgi:hypothetical protein|tara:strand:- start:3967 stop:4338 length:372 start_codon:yes stop_codon:yes gene_type:complete